MQFDNSFFEDEVRDGFFVPAEIKQAWGAELEVLSEVDKICKKHNIQYFADWGTLLAAVRHEGYIPWDDDLDIVMKRDDYNRFMKIAQTELPDGFSAYNFRNHDDLWLFLGRVVGKQRICFEQEHLDRFHQFPYIAGVDIFVLDYVSRDEKAEQERDKLAMRTIALADMIGEGKINPAMKEQELQKLERECSIDIARGLSDVELRRVLYGVVEHIFGRFTDDESDMLSQLFPFGMKETRFRFPKECYARAIELPYENIRIPVSIQYCKMLKDRYGDYMKLVRNAGGHDYPFFEMQKKQLQAVLDFDMPSYKFSPGQLSLERDRNGYKDMLQEAFTELRQLCANIAEKDIASDISMSEQVQQYLQQMQQLAIDMGTLTERVLGEGTQTVKKLEQLCEVIYQASIKQEVVDLLAFVDDSRQTFEQEIAGRKEIVFIVNKANQWKYAQWYYQKAKNEPKSDAYIIAVPYYYKKYDGSCYAEKYEIKEIKQTVKDITGTDENVMDYQQFDIALHHPDTIVIQNPCDEWNNTTTLLEEYHSRTLQKYTEKLVYIQSFEVEEFTKESYREWYNMKYYCTMPGVVRADEIYVQSENMRKLYIEKLTEFSGEQYRTTWEKKVHSYNCKSMELTLLDSVDVSKTDEASYNRRKIAFYVQIGSIIQYGDQMIGKLKSVVAVFQSNKDSVEMVWVCDSEYEKYLHDYDENLFDGYVRAKDLMIHDNLGVCIYRNEKNLNEIVEKCDAYYGSESRLVLGFVMKKKPVMIMDVEIL